MGDGIIVVDGDSLITTMNEAAEEILQLSSEHAVGHTVAEVMRDYEIDEILQYALSSGKQQTGSVEISRTKQFLLVIATPLEDEEGCLILMQNLTELRRLETVRRDFISNISHELRLPIASVKALAETLQEGATDDSAVANDFLSKINNEVDRLTQMVQELGELSRIESGEAPLTVSPFDINGVIQEVVDRFNPQADRAGLILHFDHSDVVLQVPADRERVEQVLVNLIHNAIKFTAPGGKVEISTKLGGNSIQVSVADTGVGIPADDLPRIFERFYKADKSRSSGGTGLGLAIAKHIIEAHGGRIWAESTQGRGSIFHFTLPLEPKL
jgi:two-component system phosphate regulon sensor histidine kinase PhoR